MQSYLKRQYVKCGLSLLTACLLCVVYSAGCSTSTSRIFYVDPAKGTDAGDGTLETPFQTLDRALEVVSERVDAGFQSDKIYLRGGVYRKQSTKTLYRMNLKGTPDDYAMISAMPCEPGTPEAVQRKSGQWYENVVFDDAWVITTTWHKSPKMPNVWITNPGYTLLEWNNAGLWNWTAFGFPLTDHDDTPKTTSFTVAPYMTLQDGEPLLWANTFDEITQPGMRYYDEHSGLLYLRPLGDVDPNQCKIETWYGGPEDYPDDTLYLDGEGRALFTGNMEYAGIRGCQFRMFNKLFESTCLGYDREEDRIIQRYVLFEDNLCSYGWMQILLDWNTVLQKSDSLKLNYEDRCNWHVRNNVFFRPSREICQVHGDDHCVEYNEIIDHGGPWAGPASCVSIINTRNSRNYVIRGNYIIGQGNSKWHRGSVFMIETGRRHADAEGNQRLGGQTYEYNLIANVTRGVVFYLGKGGVRTKDIKIRHNIITGSLQDEVIRICNPQGNLRIEHNVFYNLKDVIRVFKPQFSFGYDAMPSTVFITNNIFSGNGELIDQKFLSPPEGSDLTIENNVYYENADQPVGTLVRTGDPRFMNPVNFDFRIQPDSPATQKGHDSGAYDAEGSVPEGTEWWQIRQGPWASQYLQPGKHTVH